MSLKEELAALEHEQWMSWASDLMLSEEKLSDERIKRWSLFMVPYEDLPDTFKNSDRVWAEKVWAIIEKHIPDIAIKSDSLRSKDMPRGLSARGGGEEEADEDCPSGKPLGNSPNDQDDSPKFYFRTKGGMVEDLDPELQSILKHRKRI